MATISNSFTAVGNGIQASFRHNDSFTYDVSGTFVGTVILEKSVAGGFAFESVVSATGAASGTVYVVNKDQGQAAYRWRCSAYTSGTIVATMVDASSIAFGNDFYDDAGNLIMVQNEGGIQIPDGSSSLPAYSFLDDTDLGFYRVSANRLGLASSGATTLDVTTSATGATNMGFNYSLPASNTGAINHQYTAQTGGGDIKFSAVVTGGETISWGIDNSDSDAFVISNSATLGTTNRFRLATNGAASFLGTLGVTGALTASAALSTTSATVASTATIAQLSSTTSHVIISGSTGTTIQGILAGASGQRITITSVGAAVTVANANGSAAAEDRILTATGADLVGTAPCNFELIYDATATNWICVASSL